MARPLSPVHGPYHRGMRLLLLGAPGSGKGTQATRLAAHFDVAHLSTGELLRDEVARATPLGEKVVSFMLSGELVPDELVEEVIHDRLLAAARAGGYVLDGFPRTVHQAEEAYKIAREAGATVHAVILLDAPDEVLTERLLSRAQGRSDDEPDTIRRRLEVYHAITTPLIDYYRDDRGVLVTVDASQSPDSVYAAILDELPQLVPPVGLEPTPGGF